MTVRYRPALLHVISGLTTGGTEQALWRLIAHGLGKAFDNHVVSLVSEGTFGERLRDAGATVEALHIGSNPAAALFRLHRIARRAQPALVQGWMYHGNLAALIAGRAPGNGIPTLWNIRQSLPDIADEKLATRQAIRLNRLLSKRPTRIVYNSRRSREQHEAFGLSDARGCIIPNGFDLARYATDGAARLRLRGELRLPNDALVFGQFARLHPVKDQTSLLRAANMALAEGLDAYFLLAGRDVSPGSVQLHSLVEARFHDRFHLYGDRPDVPALLQAIDVYVSSSRAEAFPNVVGEAMASARPCIGTDVGDTAEIIRDTGIVVPPADPGAISAAMAALGRDERRRHMLGATARRSIEERFGISGVVDRYMDLYQGCMSNARGR